MVCNELGLEFTAANEQAVRGFEATVYAYAGFRRDIGQRLKETFAADPDMPMAHVLRGLFFQFMAMPGLLPRAQGALAAAHAAADKVERLWSARYFAFIDAHYLLALAAAGRRDQARMMLMQTHVRTQ